MGTQPLLLTSSGVIYTIHFRNPCMPYKHFPLLAVESNQFMAFYPALAPPLPYYLPYVGSVVLPTQYNDQVALY